jgi:hypothetical protein
MQEGAAIGGLGTTQAYRGAEDVMLIQWASTSNFGGRHDFDVGQNGAQKAHSLLRFDLAPLKYRMESINSITLQFTVKGLYDAGNPGGIVEVYRLADANADWVEGTYGTSQSPPPVDGFSTWSHRRRDTQPWAGSVGAGTPGVDYVNALLGSTSYTAATTGQFNLPLSGDLSFLRTWADGGPQPGFLLKEGTGTAGNRINFHSREGSNANRPVLVVDYNPRSYWGIQQGLVGHWHFDQPAGYSAAFDSTTNVNHAGFTGLSATTSWTDGLMGGALDLSSQSGEASSYIPQANGLAELTMSIWAKRDASMNDHAGVWLHRTGTTGDVTGFNVALKDDKRAQFRVMGTPVSSPVNSFVDDGDWYHLVGTWKQGELMELYIDGTKVAWTTGGVPNTPLTGSDLWRFGFDPSPGGRYFSGQLDDAAMWGRVLGPDEILELYSHGLRGISAAIVPEPSAIVLLVLALLPLGLARRRRVR